MDYLKDIQIDEKALDVEWLKQSKLMFQYASHAAQTSLWLAKEKEKLNLAKAEADRDIRTNPEKYSILKITESVVTSAIQGHPDCIEATTRYLEMNYEHDIAQAAVRALNDKRTALENLVRLYGQQYFAGPSVPRDLSKEWATSQNEKEINNVVSSKIQRKK